MQNDYDSFMADLRAMIKGMFTHSVVDGESDRSLAGTGTSNLPRVVPVDLLDVKTPDGRLIHLTKNLSIIPVGNSGLSIKACAFFAFDEAGNTIYYIPSREARG